MGAPGEPPADLPAESAESLAFDRMVWPLERYRERWRASVANVGDFWAPIARGLIDWQRMFSRPLDWQPPYAKWFPDGLLNASENCLDRHLRAGWADRPALLWEGEPGEGKRVTYGDLHRDVTRVAASLAARGFGPDDRAALYLPMVPEVVVSMLALARLGIPFTTVFSGFSADALSARLADLGAKLLITADGGYRRGRVVPLRAIAHEAVQHAPDVSTVVVVRRTKETVPSDPHRDVEWTDLLRDAPARPLAGFASDHPLFLLYTSGATGKPKAIVHGTGGYLTHLAATVKWVFDPRPDDVLWCAADVGWVTGHSYIVFGPLLAGATSVMYEGAFDHPTPDRFWTIAEHHGVSVLYTSPTALRALRKSGDEQIRGHDLGRLRLLGTVGEAINPTVWRWYFDVVGRGRCPIVDTWWQTETGGILVSSLPGVEMVPMKPGSATLPILGVDAAVVDESGRPASPGRKGYVVIRQPWPGMLLELTDRPRYESTYWSRFPGSYYAGDFAVVDEDGYFWFLGRADEVLKVAGHRLGTIEIEDALLTVPGVAEAAVCGVADPVKGEVPVAFVVLAPGTEESPAKADALLDQVEAEIGKFARPAAVHFVRQLPKTRSGKIMRRVVKVVASGRSDFGDVSTLEDEASVDEVARALVGFASEVRSPDATRRPE